MPAFWSGGTSALALTAVLALTTLSVAPVGITPSPREPFRMTRLTTGGKVTKMAISPDARYAAYVVDEDGRQALRVRQIETSGDVERIPTAPVRYAGLTFSPESTYICYT